MRVSRQVSSIVALVAVQVILFVFYSFRFHHGVRQRAVTLQLLQQPEQQFSEWSTDNTSDRGVPGHGEKTAKDVGYNTIATGVDSSTGNDKHSDTKSVSTSPLSVVNTTANASVLVRNSTRQSTAGRLAYERSTIDFGTGHHAADSNVIGRGGGGGGHGIVRSRGSNRMYPSDKKLTFLKKAELGDDCELHFLQRYSTYCEEAIVPALEVENSTLCPCVPRTLMGETHISFSFAETESEHRELLPGGRWQPTDCVARQRVAIIIPFRDRESHLEIFLRTMHPFLQRQLLHYTVFVVEQHLPKIFNKASLMNAGFKEIIARHKFDCFIFHDVDLLPETDRNLYGCYRSPRHVGAFVDKFHYKLLYKTIFGGATAFTETQFKKVNGYSNEFYGWGGEDDDMYNRIKWYHQDFIRFPKCVARYRMIKHKRDKSNPYDQKRANKAWALRPKVYKDNGLNSVAYKVESYEEKVLFTRILISLPEVPSNGPLKRSKTKS